MKDKFLDDVSQRFRVLSHPVRLRILSLMENGPHSVSEIQEFLKIPQATVSQHLQAMRNQRIVDYVKEGNVHKYRVRDQNVCGILRCIEKCHK